MIRENDAPKSEPPPRLRRNIVALGIVQISNYIFPLITLPYLTRVLGAEAYGKVAFAQALIAYFVLFVDYGFSWSATRDVAAYRSDPERLNNIFAATWGAQWLLIVLAAIALTTIVILSDQLRSDAKLYLAAFTTVVGVALFPSWFLQGLERMQVVAVLQLLTRVGTLVPIFLFIHCPKDAFWLLIIQGSGAIVGGVLALYWLFSKSILKWRRPAWSEILGALRDGGALFASRIAISAYTVLIPLSLGWVAGPVALAYFSFADKLRGAAQSLITPLSQSLFPRMSNLVKANSAGVHELVQRSALVVLVVAGLASLALWVFSDWLVILLGGRQFLPAAAVLRWLAPLPLIIGFSNIFGVQIMIPYGLNRLFNAVLISAAVLALLVVIPMTYYFGAVGAAQTVLFIEMWVVISMGALLWRKSFFKSLWRANVDKINERK